MLSGVIARTIVLDRLVGAFLKKTPARDGGEYRLLTGHALLQNSGIRPVVQSRSS